MTIPNRSASERALASVAPPPGTVERWAFDLIAARDLAQKLSMPAPPDAGDHSDAWECAPPPRRISAPGRPAELVTLRKAPKSPGPEALRAPERRARLLHTFLHHELQAAELMAFALLAFPETPRAFRRGLVRICSEELRHAQMYAEHLASLGHRYGDFGVRDWFWERVPAASSPAAFVATLGMGFEGGNLDHALRFAEKLREAGDPRAARLQEVIAEEEIPHVRFAARWFEAFTGCRDFEVWKAHLPPPLSPLVMRGAPLCRASRLRAGLPSAFLDALEAYRDPAAP